MKKNEKVEEFDDLKESSTNSEGKEQIESLANIMKIFKPLNYNTKIKI